MKVTSGTTFYNEGNLDLGSGATLQNDGTLTLKGNLVNNNTSDNLLGSGTITMQGTSAQTISGPNVFATLVINNSAGVSLTGTYDSRVSTSLTLTSGRLNLGSLNMTLGPAATVGGSPSASNMTVVTGTGQLRKEFGGNGSFTFPVGDITGTPEYSPVTLAFTSGTYPAGNYIGVNLSNSAYNTSVYTGDYLNRYWVLTNNPSIPITSFTCNASFNYVQADVVGSTEANIYCTKVAPDPVVTYNQTDATNNILLANGVNSFSTFTGTRGASTASLIAFLEGANNGIGSMTTVLPSFTAGAPYFSSSPFPLTQPYSISPWNYAGNENVGTVPAGVVDWVYLELRQGSDPSLATASTTFCKRSAFLKSDGTIVDLDGVSPVKFVNGAPAPGNNVYIVIKHRNHLAIMSNNAVTKNGSGVYSYDFTDLGTKTYGYPDGIKLKGGKWSMVGGDGYPNGLIDTDDLSFSWNPTFGGFDGYYSGDFNMTGLVDTDDLSFIWNPNFGFFGYITDSGIPRGYKSMVP